MIIQIVLVVLGLVILGGIIFVVVQNVREQAMLRKLKHQAGKTVGAAMSVKQPVVPAANPQPAAPEGLSLEIVPTVPDKSVNNYDENWRFRQPGRGRISFDVQMANGLIVTLTGDPGMPRDGYAVVIDARGGQMTNYADTRISTTYVARITNLDYAANSTALTRGVSLGARSKRHIDIVYKDGNLVLHVDGVQVLEFNDPYAVPTIQFCGFGSCGLSSGRGEITNLVIM